MARSRDLADAGVVINALDTVTSDIQSQLDGKQAFDTNLTSFVSEFTLPTADGSANQVLKTDGSGTLSFVDGSDPNALTSSDIGVTVQGYDADILTSSDIGVTVQGYDADILTSSDIGVTVQPYVTGILTQSDIGSLVQDYDLNLTDFVSAFTLPISDGTNGQALTTNGSGTLAFTDVTSVDALTSSDIGVTVQGYDADILTSSDIGVTVQGYDADILTSSDIGVTVQEYDFNLTGFTDAFTLPNVDGSADQILKTDGSGTLSFVTPSSGISDPTIGTLTKTFAQDETVQISLSNNVLVPVVTVAKEVEEGAGSVNNSWDVTGSTYTLENTAYDTTLGFSGGALVLGAGAFSDSDVGKYIYINSGTLQLIATDGSYSVIEAIDNEVTAAAGSWSMYAVYYDSASDSLKVANYVENYNIGNIIPLDSNTFSVSAQETSPEDFAFKTDGTKLYVVGNTGNDVNEYVLSTAWDVSTASYVSTFSISNESTNPVALCFKTDGSKMYVTDGSSERIYSYSLSTSWDITTSSYDSVSFYFYANNVMAPEALRFKPDGSKLYVAGNVNGKQIQEYTLSTPWDLSTISSTPSVIVGYGGTAFTGSQIYGIVLNNSGTKILLSHFSQILAEYTLSTPWDLSTLSLSGPVREVVLNLSNNAREGLVFGDEGNKLFVLERDLTSIFAYSTSSTKSYETAFSPTTSTLGWGDINSFTATDSGRNIFYAISNDSRTSWTIMDNVGGSRGIVRYFEGSWQYNSNETYALETWTNSSENTERGALKESMVESPALNLDFATYTNKELPSIDSNPLDVVFSATGYQIYTIGSTGDRVYQYNLSTPWDIATATRDSSMFFSVSSQENTPAAIHFKPDGTRMYISGWNGDDVNEYTLSTPWEVNTASFTTKSSTLPQEGAIGGIHFKPDGTKMYATGFFNDTVYEYTLSTPWDSSTISFSGVSYDLQQDVANLDPTGLAFNNGGTSFFVCCPTNDKVYQYNLSTPWDISTTFFSNKSVSIAPSTNVQGVSMSSDGGIFVVIDATTDRVHQYKSPASQTQRTYNQMDSATLNALTDANQITLADSLDFVSLLEGADASYSGTSINYDGGIVNNAAILGTDYTFKSTAPNNVFITALTAGNYKIRVV